MKKVLLYTDTPQIGGAELQIFLLAKFLDKEKFTPILTCSNYKSLDAWCGKFEKEGIQVIRLNVRHKHDPRHYTQIKKILEQQEIDILHLHIWNPASCRWALLAAKDYPTITTEHDPFKLGFLKNTIKKNLLKSVNQIITVSKNNLKTLGDIYPQEASKMTVIHNGIDVTWWQSQLIRFTEKDRTQVKEGLFGARENTLIISTIAELHERKGLKYLIAAMEDVVVDFPNVKLIIIGEGGERSNLEKQIKELELARNITLVGRQKEIPKLLKSSDIFVLPSRREAFGLVNAEAMITPLPVIATKVGGIPEIVQDDKTGIIVESENSQALSQAVKKLITEPQLRQEFAKAGQKRILEHFSSKKMAEKYQKVYEQLI